MTASNNPSHADYTFAWICALPLELAAASAMLDETYPSLRATTTHNAYTLGRVQGHNIVLTCLPVGMYGTTSATAVVSHLLSTFPNLRYGILVGIGGGVPSKSIDIRLGDVVVSKPTGNYGGVVQYDIGKAINGGHFQHIGMLNQPPTILLTAVSQLEANYMRSKSSLILNEVLEVFRRNPDMKEVFSRPLTGDRLFRATYNGAFSESSFIQCDPGEEIKRAPRPSTEPQIHYGIIASGNRVIKSGHERDTIAQNFNAICFEMEAAGIMNHLPCLVIRGICDYCDSHKNKEWQGYAALIAAIYARSLLSVIPADCSRQENMPNNEVWMVPFSRNPRFIGRDLEINQLKARVLSNHARKAAISGLGGVGKTQIAVELAYRMKEQYPRRSFFWIPSTSLKSIEQAFLNIGQHLGMQNVRAADVKSWVKAYLSSEKARPWLLIVDNADDPDMWTLSKSSPALKSFLPQSQNGFILFTTRNEQLATRLAGPDIMRVSEIDEVPAIELLHNSLVQDDMSTGERSASMLVCKLGGLPLALVQAASFMNENSISLETYVSLLNKEEHTMINLLSEDFEDDYRYPDSKNPVASTWLISFRQIQKSSDLAAKLLSFIACIDPRDIPLSLFPSSESEIDQHKALGLLKSYSFITKQANNQFISMHRLVHLATRSWLRSENLLQKITTEVAEHLYEVFSPNNQRWHEYLPHVQFILQNKELQTETEMREALSQRAGQCLYNNGRYREAEIHFQDVFERRDRRLRRNDPDLFSSVTWMAATYTNLGLWEKAGELEVRVMEMRETMMGAGHFEMLTGMANLASTYQNQGRWREAEELEVQVLDTRKQVLGAKHPDTLSSMDSLASIYWAQGQLKEAEELETQVMEIWKRILGPEHPDTLTSMANLASTYWNRGRWKEAEELEVQVMETRKQVLGPEHPDTLTSMANLVFTYWNQGQWKEAEQVEVQVIEIWKKILGPEHPDTLTSMANLASTYWNQGRWKEAEELEIQVMETRKKMLGPEHPDTLTSMDNLAYTWESLGNIQDALALMKKCAELRNKVLGSDHPDSMSSCNVLTKWETAQQTSTDPPALPVHTLPHQIDLDSKSVSGTKRRAFLKVFRKR